MGSELPSVESIPGLLSRHLPIGVIMAVDDALKAGAQRAYAASKGMEEGHLPHVVGQLRHFHMNESFYRALASEGVSPTAIRGNGLVVGRSGIFTLARFNIPQGLWINSRRSKTRRRMSTVNKTIDLLVQPDLFERNTNPSDAVVFFAACFSGSLRVSPDAPLSIQLAVPRPDMRDWLFREPLDVFLQRYDWGSTQQADLAVPRLKKGEQRHADGDAS